MYTFGSDAERDDFIDAARNGSAFAIQIVIGRKIVPETSIKRFTYHDSIGRGGEFTIGTVSSSSVTFTSDAAITAEDVIGEDIFVSIGLETGDAGEYTYVPLGQFTADKENVQIMNEQIRVTAYDSVWSGLDVGYITNLEFPNTVFAVLDEIEDLAGLVIAEEIPTMPDGTYPIMYEKPSGTYRDAIAQCAGLLGCNASIDRNGNLHFIRMGTASPVIRIFNDDVTANGFSLLSDMFNISGLRNTWTHDSTDVYDNIADDGSVQKTTQQDDVFTYDTGFGSAILSLNSPNLRTQEEVDLLGMAAIGDSGVHYNAYKLLMRPAPYLSAGDLVTFYQVAAADAPEDDALNAKPTFETAEGETETEEDIIGDITDIGDEEDTTEGAGYEETITSEEDIVLTDFESEDIDGASEVYTLYVMDHTLALAANGGLQSTLRAVVPAGEEDTEIPIGGNGYLTISGGIETAQETADEARRLVVDTIAAQEAHFQKLTADEAKIQSLEADSAEIKNLVAEKASISDLTAATGRIDSLETGKASVSDLKSSQANIDALKTSKADIDFANVTVGNVSEAWIKNLFVQGGFIAQSGTVYNLVGVRIDGDLITANTVKADKLLLQGGDGLYYAINVNALGETTASSDAKYQEGIDGSVIVAHSITADQITANNIVGTGGWINLAEGRFKYGNTGTGNFISWDGKSLEISLDKLNITSSSGISISVGERLADTLADVTVEYADSTSPTIAPTSGWSTTAPEWQEGHYTWSRTTSTNIDGTTKTSDPVCITGNAGGQGPPGADGKDAILLQIDSVNGTQFKNTGIATTLTVTIRYGDKTITKSSQLYEAFGSSAYLTWSEKKMGETEFTPLTSGDSRIGDNGFYLTIGADDVDEKSVFGCELNF